MTARAATITALALLVAASACGGPTTAPPLPPPRPPEPLAANCGPGDAPSPEVVAQYVEYLRTLLLEYEDIAGRALGGAAWSTRRASFREHLVDARDISALSRALVVLEAGLAPRMPESWARRRGAWTRALDGSPRLTAFWEGLRELIGVLSKLPEFDDQRREQVRRIYTRVSLLFDTCLAAGA